MLKRCLLSSARVLMPLALVLTPFAVHAQPAVVPNYRCGTTVNSACEGSMWTAKTSSALTNTAVAVKTTAGILGIAYCYNPNSTVAYVQVFNVATGSVTVGTTAPTFFFAIPATSIGGFGFGGGSGLYFSTAISIAATTTSTGGSAPSTALECSEGYN